MFFCFKLYIFGKLGLISFFNIIPDDIDAILQVVYIFFCGTATTNDDRNLLDACITVCNLRWECLGPKCSVNIVLTDIRDQFTQLPNCQSSSHALSTLPIISSDGRTECSSSRMYAYPFSHFLHYLCTHLLGSYYTVFHTHPHNREWKFIGSSFVCTEQITDRWVELKPGRRGEWKFH